MLRRRKQTDLHSAHHESAPQLATDKEKILSSSDFLKARQEAGFLQGHRGTYWTADKSRFLYTKRCHEVASEELARKSLAFARFLTLKGVLHPATRWGAYESAGLFQLYAVSPGLTDYWEEQRNPDPSRKSLKHIPSNDLEQLFDEDSQVLEMFRRVDPDFDPNQPPPEDSILWLLNPFEASHEDNWGWDVSGERYPVDVEVIDFDRPNTEAIIDNWLAQQYS